MTDEKQALLSDRLVWPVLGMIAAASGLLFAGVWGVTSGQWIAIPFAAAPTGLLVAIWRLS